MARSMSCCRAAFLAAASSLWVGRWCAMVSPLLGCDRRSAIIWCWVQGQRGDRATGPIGWPIARWGRWAGSGDRVLDRPAGELGASAQPGLLAGAREVVLHRARRDVQLPAELVVGQAVGHQAQDLQLARGQQRPHRGPLTPRAARE